MGYLFIGIILVMKALQGAFNKQTSLDLNCKRHYISYSLYKSSVSAGFGIILLLITGTTLSFDPQTLAISTLAGISMGFSGICALAALKSGTISLCTLVSAAGLLVPSILGIFLFGEAVSPLQGLGVLILFFAAYLLVGCSKDLYGKLKLKTVFFLLGSLLFNGSTMLAQKMFTYYVPKGSASVFSMWSFAISATVFLVILSFFGKGKKSEKIKFPPKLYLYGAILAVALFTINQLATMASALIPSIILFTLVNGGGLLIITVIAALLYREKITLKSGSGIVLGISALLIINFF